MTRRGVNINFNHLADLVGGSRAEALAVFESARFPEEIRCAARDLDAVTLDRDHYVAVGNRNGALLQSFLAVQALGDLRSFVDPNGLLQPSFSVRDYAMLVDYADWAQRQCRPTRPSRDRANVVRIGDSVNVALFGDWAAGTPASARVADSIARSACDVRIHLGDVYYSGTRDETVGYLLEPWPVRGATLNRACNSNHEMYSGGEAYANLTLSALGQESPYFLLQNRYWTIVGLDTGSIDGRISGDQLRDTVRLIEQSGDRRVILLSHHPLYAWASGMNRELLSDVWPALSSGRVLAWYWAHEHAYLRFERDEFGLFASCVGHGGFPYLNVPTEREVAARSGNFWLTRVQPVPGCPSSVVLRGPSDLGSNADDYGPMGWLCLTLDGPTIIERVIDLDGTPRFERVLDGS